MLYITLHLDVNTIIVVKNLFWGSSTGCCNFQPVLGKQKTETKQEITALALHWENFYCRQLGWHCKKYRDIHRYICVGRKQEGKKESHFY